MTSSPDETDAPVLEDPDLDEIVAHAIQEDLSLTEAARVFVPERKLRSTVRRARRALKKKDGGEGLIKMFLQKGARYDRMVAGRLACGFGQVAEVISWGRVPLSDACDGLPEKDNVYRTLYNRIYRENPDVLPKLTGKRDDQGGPASAFRFFNISYHELEKLKK